MRVFSASFGLLFLLGGGLALGQAALAAGTPAFAVGAQYDSTHVYVAPADLDPFVASFVATFGGSASPKISLTVTPTPSTTAWRFISSPAGSVSVFGFTTPVPYPFGAERTGYLVTDMDAAVAGARAAGADLIVAPFPDPVGRDAVVQWPGGVDMQLYWHTVAQSAAALATVPENRVYISADRVAAFVTAWTSFAHGTVVSDEQAPGTDIGRPGQTFRRVRISSNFGKLTLLVSDGHLPYPYGRELTGYEVAGLNATLAKAVAAGASVLNGPYDAGGRRGAMVRFPGGYIAEIHQLQP